MTRVLVIQLAKMGDLLQSASLFQRLKDQEHEITLLHSDVFSGIIPHLPIDNNYPLNLDLIAQETDITFVLLDNLHSRQLINELNTRQFDIVINLNSNLLSEQIIKAINAPDKYGHGSANVTSCEWLYYHMSFIKARHHSSFNLVDIFANIVSRDVPLLYIKPQHNPNGQYLFQAVSRSSKRLWPPAYWVHLADACIDAGKIVSFIGTQPERAYIDNICAMMQKKAANLAGTTTLDELITLINNCELLVTGDTGSMHIAARLGIPFTAIFTGPAFASETLGYAQQVQVITPANFTCYPCDENTTCPYQLACQKSISPTQVFAKINSGETDTLQDKMGQIIPSQMSEMGQIYRNFALQYFFKKTSPPFIISQELKKDLKRELIICKKLINTSSQIPRLKYLQIIFWLRKLSHNLPSNIVPELINFIDSQLG